MNTQTKALIRQFIDNFSFISSRHFYSQLGEDAVLQSFFRTNKSKHTRVSSLLNLESIKPGFYVDIGAYSPRRLSNSFWFYQHGWRGITIEPNPLATSLFRRSRPRDTHLEMAVSAVSGKLYYYTKGYDVTNYISTTPEQPQPGFRSFEIESLPLSTIFERYLPDSQPIDFLSVDCEGHDLEVLLTNDWDKFRPWLVLAEVHAQSLGDLRESPIVKYLDKIGYDLISWTLATLIFRDRNRAGHEPEN